MPALVRAAPTLSPGAAGTRRPSKTRTHGRSADSVTKLPNRSGANGWIEVDLPASERLSDELGRTYRQADPGSFVPAGLPKTRCVGVWADHGQVVDSTGGSQGRNASPSRCSASGTARPPWPPSWPRPGATRADRSPRARAKTRSARCRCRCLRRRERFAGPHRARAHWRRTPRVHLVVDCRRQRLGDQHETAAGQNRQLHAGQPGDVAGPGAAALITAGAWIDPGCLDPDDLVPRRMNPVTSVSSPICAWRSRANRRRWAVRSIGCTWASCG